MGSGDRGTTMRLGHTNRSVSVWRRKGSSHSMMGFTTTAPPNCLPTSSVKWICVRTQAHLSQPLLIVQQCSDMLRHSSIICKFIMYTL